MSLSARIERRRLKQRVKRLTERIEDITARRELIRLVQAPPSRLTFTGKVNGSKDFALCVTPDGLRYGEKDTDGSCDLEAYGPDGDFLFGWGGDNLDLPEEVRRQL